MLSKLKVKKYTEIRNLKVEYTEKTLFGSTKEILFKDDNEVSFQLGIELPCYIKTLSKNPRSYIEMEISNEVFNQIKSLEKKIVGETPLDVFFDLQYNKPIVYEKETSEGSNRYCLLSPLFGSRMEHFCKVKKETSEISIDKWPISVEGFCVFRILGLKINNKEGSFNLVTDIVEIKEVLKQEPSDTLRNILFTLNEINSTLKLIHRTLENVVDKV